MMNKLSPRSGPARPLRHRLAALLLTAAGAVQADAVTDWNLKAAAVVTEARIGTPVAIRAMAIVQTAVHDAVAALPAHGGARAVSAEAAVAAAYRQILLALMPAQRAMIETAYQAALDTIGDKAASSAGIAIGERAAVAVLAARAQDGAATPESWRPPTVPGAYVTTGWAAVPQWATRKPWLLSSPAQVRPPAPPALNSAAWARDFNETRTLGGRTSLQRVPAQTEIARFWEYSLPDIYHGVVHSVAKAPDRGLARNARLFAAVAQAMDDAMIAAWDAKYHYNFWRPATAIRNGDLDGNDATPREASWLPLIEPPMHPEYPSGHSILASAVATVLRADVGRETMPTLSTTSPTAGGAVRRWTTIDDNWTSADAFVREVSSARVYAGVHFRSATEASEVMGQRIGEMAAQRLLRARDDRHPPPSHANGGTWP